MSKDGQCGDELTLRAISTHFNVPIIVVSSVQGNSFVEIMPFKNFHTIPPQSVILFLSHYAEFHYSTLILDRS
jgi:hypothetical protein